MRRRDAVIPAQTGVDEAPRVHGVVTAYQVHMLVWYEPHEPMESANLREKAIKERKGRWKIELIEKENPLWRDLYRGLL